MRASFVQGTVNPGVQGGSGGGPFLPDSGFNFSGTPAFDQQFTITSTNSVFGPTGPTLVIFDDFRSGTPGTVVPNNTPGVAGSSNWQNGTTSFGNPIYQTPNASGSGNCIRIYNDNRAAGSYQLVLNFANTNQIYICWKENSHGTDYTTFSNNFGNNWNYKMHWLMQNGHVGGAFNEWLPAIFATFSGSTFTGTNMQIASNDVPPLPDEFFTSGSPYDPNNWNTCELGYVGNAANPTTAAGLLFHSIYNPTTTRAPKTQGQYTFSKNTDVLFNSGSGANGDYTNANTLNVPGLMQGEPASVVVDRADYYVAIGPNCLNRFFIGDQPTIGACTTITPCTINSWSANSVTLTPRQGAFKALSPNFLYWSDNNNNIQRVGQFTPLALPLVQSNTPLLTYLGSFQGPLSGSFQYGGGSLSVAGSSPGVLGQLYASGLQQGNNTLGSMNIPSPTGANGTYVGTETATQVVAGTTSVNLGALGGSSQTSTTGSLVYNGKLYVTGAIDYDANGDQNAFMVIGNTNITGFGSAFAANGTSGNISRMFSNGMNLVPAIWQPLLGGPAYVFGGPGGGSGLSINSQLANGYGFSTFDPGTVLSAGKVNLKEWINYPYSNPNGRFAGPLSGFMTTTQSNWSTFGDNLITQYDGPVGCAFIAPGSRTLLFLHHHVYGPIETGAGTDPCNTSASGAWDSPVAPDTQSYRRFQFVAYDLGSVLTANPNGTTASAPRPYAWWEFPNWKTLWGSSGACSNNFDCTGRETQAFATFDYANNRLYVSMGWPGVNGTVYVFQVNSL